MARYNSRNNGGTAHLFGTTAKMPTVSDMPRLSEPPAAERAMQSQDTEMAPPTSPTAPTFADMQRQGRARPPAPSPMGFGANPAAASQRQFYGPSGPPRQVASVTLNPAATGRRVTPTNPILIDIQNTLAGRGTTPTRFDTDLYQRLRDAALGDIEADFGARRQALDEEMARRGLYSSSLAGGRMGDLEGQYARARTTMEANLLAQAAETQMQDRIARDQMMMQLAQMLAGMDSKARTAFLQQLAPQGG